MKNSQFKAEDVFGVVLREKSSSIEQKTKLNSFLTSMMQIKILKLI